VRENLHPREEGERAVVVVLDASDLEHAVRAHLDAVALRLAARAIHDRDPRARRRLAELAGAIGMRGGSSRLLGALGPRLHVASCSPNRSSVTSARPSVSAVRPAALARSRARS